MTLGTYVNTLYIPESSEKTVNITYIYHYKKPNAQADTGHLIWGAQNA